MATVVVTLDVAIDGRSLFGVGPLVRRYEAPSVVDVTVPKAADNNATAFAAVAVSLETLGMLLIRPDGTLNVRLNGQDSESIPLNPDGLILILDAAMTDDPTFNNPDEAEPVALQMIVVGT